MRFTIALVLTLAIGVGTASARTTTIPSDSNDPAWLKAHGLTPVATLEVANEAAKLPANCWHARVFAGLRDYGGGFAVWAYHKGIVCPDGKRLAHFHERHGKGSNGEWHDGPYPSLTSWNYVHGYDHIFSYYKTDWKMGNWAGPNWGVKLSLDQYLSHKVGRHVHWTHYPSA